MCEVYNENGVSCEECKQGYLKVRYSSILSSFVSCDDVSYKCVDEKDREHRSLHGCSRCEDQYDMIKTTDGGRFVCAERTDKYLFVYAAVYCAVLLVLLCILVVYYYRRYKVNKNKKLNVLDELKDLNNLDKPASSANVRKEGSRSDSNYDREMKQVSVNNLDFTSTQRNLLKENATLRYQI